MLRKCLGFRTKPYQLQTVNIQSFQLQTKVLPLTVLQRKDLDHIDHDRLIDIVCNVGFLKLEIAPHIRDILDEIDQELKFFYKEINYGQTLQDKQMLSHWWPQQLLFFGYSNHINDPKPSQFEQFHVNPTMMHHELNPFKEMANVMTLFDYLCTESYEIFEKIWVKLGIFPLSDFETMLGGKKELNQTIAVNNFDPRTLTMNSGNKAMDGFPGHSDSGLLTILRSGGPGFQVFYNGEWHDIDYHDRNENFVLNFGCLMAETTKHTKIPFTSCRHRVIPITDFQRLSIAIFNDAPWDGMLYQYDENQKLSPYKTYKSHIQSIYDAIVGRE